MTIKIIAEIGINHKGSYTRAKELINIAHKAKAWAVKFQYRDYKNFYANKNEIGDEILEKEIKKVHLNFEKINNLRKYAKKLKLKTGISFFKIEDFKKNKKFINYFDFLKIPSSEFSNFELIKEYKKTKKKIFLSTGGNEGKEILKSINNLNKNQFVVFHCISNYPTLTGFQQLNFLKKLVIKSKLEIGYSSHDEDWEINLFAMTTGIKYIERHLTIDKFENGLDDSSSSDENEFVKLCFFANKFNQIMGNNERILNQGEILNMQNLGTSLYANKNIKINSRIQKKDFIVKAPRVGITPKQFINFKNKKTKSEIKKGAPILFSNFSSENIKLQNSEIAFSNRFNLSLPIRIHDFRMLNERFPIKLNELHLSYEDVFKLKNNSKILNQLINKDIKYSIHLPDYVSKNNLLDPVSNNKNISLESVKIIKTVKEITKFISDKTNNNVNIIGSFSRSPLSDKFQSLDIIFECLKNLESKDFKILPQWLPKIAWYFGGAEIQKNFCDENDIKYIMKNKISICLDVSHLILSANYAEQKWKSWYDKLIKFTKIIHLSDAKGIDGEGIKLGEGDIGDFSFILQNENVKVLETWQGHLNNGKRFLETIKYIKKRYG